MTDLLEMTSSGHLEQVGTADKSVSFMLPSIANVSSERAVQNESVKRHNTMKRDNCLQRQSTIYA
jgi:hypothetical protein